MSTEEKEITGRIIKVDQKGYGFIISPEIKFTRIFFHWTSLVQDTLNFAEVTKGMYCRFTPKEIEGKGIRAIRITILKQTPAKEIVLEEGDTGE